MQFQLQPTTIFVGNEAVQVPEVLLVVPMGGEPTYQFILPPAHGRGEDEMTIPFHSPKIANRSLWIWRKDWARRHAGRMKDAMPVIKYESEGYQARLEGAMKVCRKKLSLNDGRIFFTSDSRTILLINANNEFGLQLAAHQFLANRYEENQTLLHLDGQSVGFRISSTMTIIDLSQNTYIIKARLIQCANIHSIAGQSACQSLHQVVMSATQSGNQSVLIDFRSNTPILHAKDTV